MTDEVLDRITYDPGTGAGDLAPIPWPSGLGPRAAAAPRLATSLPAADVLVITWTAAEARALADVLTPGVPSNRWAYYKTGWAAYLPQLTDRSPAKGEGRLASWCMTLIGSLRVCCVKSELHPATDGPTIPAALLACQLAAECGAQLVITTGTAGGASEDTVLGDVNIAAAVGADFTTRLARSPLARQTWAAPGLSTGQEAAVGGVFPLFAANAGALPSAYATRPPQVWQGATVTTDSFAFDTSTDYYGLRAFDPDIRAVEMDDAPVASALYIGRGVPVLSVRNASDPVMPGSDIDSDKQTAQTIYQRYGYWTTVNSAIVTWALISGLLS